MRIHWAMLATVAFPLAVCHAQQAGEPQKFPTEFKKWDRVSYERSSPFPELMSECALPRDQLPKIVPGHPRLLVRAADWAGGLSVAQVRERAKLEPWAKQLKSKYFREPEYGAQCGLYYLATGDESVVPGLVDFVLAAKPQANCGGSLVEPCLVYDWIAASPSLTDAQRKKMADHIVATADGCARGQEAASANDMWHHRGAAGWASDVLAAGLALAGEHAEADRLLAWGAGYFRNNYFCGWARTGGQHMGGGHRYYRAGAGRLPLAIALWHSAGVVDVCEEIRTQHNDFLQGNMYAMMYQVLPDRTRVESTGFDYAPTHLVEGNYLITSWCYRNPDGYAFMKWLGQDPRSHSLSLLLYDEKAAAAAVAKLPLEGPSARMWGGSGLGWFGYVQMRSNGWQPDSTVVEFKCGDRFWSHGFNTNQNSFYIFRRNRLAPHSGYYSDWDLSGRYKYFARHMRNYYCQTVASNSMLVIDPDEWCQTSPGMMENQDKQGFYPVYGSQRLHRGGSNCFSFQEFMAEMTDADDPFECGDLVAFEHAADYSWTYTCGDATVNYNNPKSVYGDVVAEKFKHARNKPKVERFTRSLAWLGNRYLVVFDRVTAADAAFRKAWLLHSIDRPKVAGKLVKTEVPGHIETFDGDTVTIDWTDGFLKPTTPETPGRLFSRTFLPADHVIRRVGGEGYEFYAADRNWPPMSRPTKEKPGADPMDPGAWRVEVSPARPARDDRFLHLLFPTDATVEKMPAAEMVRSADGHMVGLAVDDWLVLFGADGRVDGPIALDAPRAGRALLVDLTPGASYRVTGVNEPLAASKSGVIECAIPRAGRVTVEPVQPVEPR